ncbi:hypothetical protein LA080_002482 [Diaporthe eres]|nr:hypothetical protein LA080_002482 [Diaporthe eres]
MDVTDLELQKFPDRVQAVLLKAKAIADPHIMDPKCRLCYQRSRVCLKEPGNDKCNTCIKFNRPCNWDLEGAKSRTDLKGEKSKTDLKGAMTLRNADAVSPDQACLNCKKATTNCDGKDPCSRCSRLNLKCVPQPNTNDTPKCLHCVNKGTACDRGRPCGTCIKHGATCTYRDQYGLVVRRYNLNVEREKRGWPPYDEPEDECANCMRKHVGRCDQGEPCFQCVSENLRGTAQAPNSCVYRSPDNGGMTESWYLACWTLGTSKDEYSYPPVMLEDNWEQILVDQTAKRTQNSLDTWARRRSGASNVRELSPERPHEQAWRMEFESDFPHGAVEVPTSGQGRLCAWYALRNSIQHQLPGVRVPDVDELQAIYNRLAGENPEFEMGNSNTFRLDQLIITAQSYLERCEVRRRIGLVYPFKGRRHFPYIYSQSDHLSDEPVLWLYNDNREAQSWQDAHFWGLRPATPKEHQDQAEQRRDEDTDPSSGDDDPEVRRRMRKPLVDDDVAEFIDQGSMRKDASVSSRIQARAVMLAALANVAGVADATALDDYDAEDGPEPASYAEAMRMPDAEGWQAAIDREISSLRENDVFKVVRRSDLPPRRRLLLGKFIFKRKIGFNLTTKKYKCKYKARLVAKGFQ